MWGIQFLLDIYQKGYAPKDSVNWGFNEIVAGFYSGTCAMLDQDPDALIAALSDRAIAAAGLDVFEGEPHLPAELRALENVILSPHMGATTHESLDNGLALLRANLAAHFAGEAVPTPVIEPARDWSGSCSPACSRR